MQKENTATMSKINRLQDVFARQEIRMVKEQQVKQKIQQRRKEVSHK